MPSEEDLRPFVEDLAEELASVYELPVYFYEKSERARKESELPSLRKGGFGGLFGRRLSPDFGPATMHERLGLAVIGVRDFHLVFHTNLGHDDGTQARRIARTIRHLRMEGDPRFPGVRSMAFVLGSTQQTQVHFVSTMPDLAAVDPIVEFVAYEAALYGATLAEAEVIGVIRPADLPRATRLVVQDRQVVQGTE